MKKPYNKPQITTKSFSDKPHVYCTVNKVNGKVYVGVHNGNNPSYIGSGTSLLSAVEKYGRENFVKTILCEFDDVKDAFAKEAEIVNEQFIKSKDNYNMKVGGLGGFSESCHKAANEVHRANGFQNSRKGGKAAQKTLKKNKSCAFHNKDLQKQSSQKAWDALKEDGYSKSYAKKTETCPHCNKSGNAMAMKRWHFDNCKLNSTNQSTP